MNKSISPEALREYKARFDSDPLGRVAARAASKTDLNTVCCDLQQTRAMNHRFSLDIPTMDACNQKASGRCWIFAGLNILREKLGKALNIENLELSQNYIAFYDHLEKANTFLEHILETAQSPLEDRYVSMLLSSPVGDGGWWEYFVGLTEKYGVVPADAMPDTYQSSHTENMNLVLNMQLRKDALSLRRLAAEGAPESELRSRKDASLGRVYRLLCVCLGTPPDQFDFEYVDREKVYHAQRDQAPVEFYRSHLGSDLPQVVSILNAPCQSIPYYRVYYTEGEESIYGSWQAKRLNLPMEEFKAAVLRQLQDGEPVWFVCDCDYYGSKEDGIWDTALYDYEHFFGLDLQMDKGDLLLSRQCSLNHAMVLTGVNLVEGKPDKWKVQNSWGEDCAKKGYFILSDAWFDRYVFTASIHRKYLTEAENRAFDREPVVMTPWNVLA